ncbi:unnamed protein product [Albugo candida]|uniref:Uncharacterized protein n=1 Tax=Albugo candida TaxID=65357 RepID=A0A024FUC6_9STRA|nr:unnamed protein product [Albugo candida]|eukprot:CCI10269.1 unnamed protein product [Albugo candida]
MRASVYKLMVAACGGIPEHGLCFVVSDNAKDGEMELVIEVTGPGMYDSDVIAFEPEYTASETTWKLPPPQHDVNTSLSLASLDYSKVPKLKPFCVYRANLPHQLSFEWVGTSDPKLLFKNAKVYGLSKATSCLSF